MQGDGRRARRETSCQRHESCSVRSTKTWPGPKTQGKAESTQGRGGRGWTSTSRTRRQKCVPEYTGYTSKRGRNNVKSPAYSQQHDSELSVICSPPPHSLSSYPLRCPPRSTSTSQLLHTCSIAIPPPPVVPPESSESHWPRANGGLARTHDSFLLHSAGRVLFASIDTTAIPSISSSNTSPSLH